MITLLRRFVLLLCAAVPVFGLDWPRGWEAPLEPGAGRLTVDRQEAASLRDAVDSPETLRRAVDAWEHIAAAAPTEREAWLELASLHLLDGAAFRTSRGERRAVPDQSVDPGSGANPEHRARGARPRLLGRVGSRRASERR